MSECEWVWGVIIIKNNRETRDKKEKKSHKQNAIEAKWPEKRSINEKFIMNLKWKDQEEEWLNVELSTFLDRTSRKIRWGRKEGRRRELKLTHDKH